MLVNFLPYSKSLPMFTFININFQCYHFVHVCLVQCSVSVGVLLAKRLPKTTNFCKERVRLAHSLGRCQLWLHSLPLAPGEAAAHHSGSTPWRRPPCLMAREPKKRPARVPQFSLRVCCQQPEEHFLSPAFSSAWPLLTATLWNRCLVHGPVGTFQIQILAPVLTLF